MGVGLRFLSTEDGENIIQVRDALPVLLERPRLRLCLAEVFEAARGTLSPPHSEDAHRHCRERHVHGEGGTPRLLAENCRTPSLSSYTSG